ncbi:hypothetical protein LINPERPRIM_LOCUS13407 [Linum perenne]
MVHRLSFEAVDRPLCDIMNRPSSGPGYKPFGDSTSPDWIKIPDLFLINPNNDPYGAIIHDIYSNFLQSYSDIAYIKNRAIVTPTNQVVSDINARMLAEVPGEIFAAFLGFGLCCGILFPDQPISEMQHHMDASKLQFIN